MISSAGRIESEGQLSILPTTIYGLVVDRGVAVAQRDDPPSQLRVHAANGHHEVATRSSVRRGVLRRHRSREERRGVRFARLCLGVERQVKKRVVLVVGWTALAGAAAGARKSRGVVSRLGRGSRLEIRDGRASREELVRNPQHAASVLTDDEQVRTRSREGVAPRSARLREHRPNGLFCIVGIDRHVVAKLLRRFAEAPDVVEREAALPELRRPRTIEPRRFIKEAQRLVDCARSKQSASCVYVPIKFHSTVERSMGGGTHISDVTDIRYGSHFKERYKI